MASTVVVSTLSGKSLELPLDGDRTASDVKEALASSIWRVPEECQSLVGSDTFHPLQDSDPVGDGQITLLISLEPIRRDPSKDTMQRVTALRRLKRLGSGCICPDMAIPALVEYIQDPTKKVQIMTMSSLAELAEQGNRRAVIKAVARCISDDEPASRSAGLDALVYVAQKADEEAVQLALRCLEDSVPLVRRAAASAIRELGEREDRRCVAALLPLLQDREEVQEAALEALREVAPEGDATTIAAIGDFLELQELDCESELEALALGVLAALRPAPAP